jgi:type IV pilus assembly protein PilY1
MKTRPLWSRPRRTGALALVGVMLMEATTPVFATVSQLPGLFVTPPDANVMFTLDDSGRCSRMRCPTT